MKELNLKVMNLRIERQFLSMAYILQMSQAQTLRCSLGRECSVSIFQLAMLASQVNLVVKAGGIELKRYSFTNQTIHAIQEVFYGQGGLKAGRNMIEFEIVDTPMTETGVIKISDAVVYYSTYP